jgi:hypothetical protein
VRVRAEGPTRVFEVSDSDRSGVLTASAGRVGDRLGTVWPDTGDPSGTTDCVPALNPIHFAFGRCVDLRVKIGSVGVSLIDGRPTELVYLLVSNVQVQFVETVRAKQIDVVLGNLEINNQVCVCVARPVVLCDAGWLACLGLVHLGWWCCGPRRLSLCVWLVAPVSLSSYRMPLLHICLPCTIISPACFRC